MINIIHFFNDSIDHNSILNTRAVLGDLLARHIIVYIRPNDDKLNLKGIEYHAIGVNQKSVAF